MHRESHHVVPTRDVGMRICADESIVVAVVAVVSLLLASSLRGSGISRLRSDAKAKFRLEQ